MRKPFLAIVFAALFLSVVLVSLVSAQTTTIADARIGISNTTTYRYVEVFQVEGRWIFPDIGYIDFADAKRYGEWFVGAGFKSVMTKHVTVAHEVYFVRSVGSASGDAKYTQVWTGIFYTFTDKLGGEAAFFPYIPLNSAATKQWVVERIKLEYSFTPAFKAGAGYGAYQFGNGEWQNRPFITTTVTPAGGKFGSFELWYQKLPNGKSQIQVRYELAHVSKKK